MRVNFLKNLYLTALTILILIVIATPSIIKSGIPLLKEEYLEEVLIMLILIVGYFVYTMYRRELAKNIKALSEITEDKKNLEDQLIDAFKYIGNTNAQIEVFKSVFTGMEKYPKNKKEMTEIMQLLARNILKIASIDWVVFRLIDIRDEKTLRELSETRGNAILIKYKVNNKDLIDNKIDNYQVVSSKQNNMNIKGFCFFPKTDITNEQKIMFEAVVSQLEMLFIIFSSGYYRD